MKPRSIGFHLLCVLLLSINAVAHAAPAHAAPHKKKGAKGNDKVPVSAEISKSMGDLQWGISKDELQKKLIDKVKETYRPLVAKTKDAVEEDRLRQKATDEMKRIKESFVEFTGTSTGWDVSFLRGEFTHGNDESMLVMKDANSQNFYFFIDGRLWKWYKAFDAEVFRAGDFSSFAGAVQKRFGPAKDVTAELTPGSGQRHWLEWQDDKSRLRAVDQSDFYGFYCLVFEEKATVGKLAQLRTNTRDVGGSNKHALVEAVTAAPSKDIDNSADITDRITGKMRAQREAPSESSSSKSGKGSKSSSSSSSESSASAPSGVKSDDDPLRGLGL